MKVDLIWISDNLDPPHWTFGKVWKIIPTPNEIANFIEKYRFETQADALLFWDGMLGKPDGFLLEGLLDTTNDVWHAGLKLGTTGKPDFIDFVSPNWMLNRDPSSQIEATSWRLSLHCCLIRTEVIRQMGGLLNCFSTLDAAGLEMGYRYVRKGVFIRHVPDLVNKNYHFQDVPDIPIDDQLNFIKAGLGEKWMWWAAFRAVMSRSVRFGDLIRGLGKVRNYKAVAYSSHYKKSWDIADNQSVEESVSVLIPTLNRYPYLKTLLGQLRAQTVKPFEILIIDQTPEEERDLSLREAYHDLPIQWVDLEVAGQCSSRNLGLRLAKGEYILFIDDDDEIPDNLIELHLKNINSLKVNISIGVAHDIGNDLLPNDFKYQRISDVFPTGNTMIKKNTLMKSGLFDMAYERGMVEDHDLGMRLYLCGEKMILNPTITVLHHHAPQGGLREHKARIDTYAKSRKKITSRVLPSVSELYFARRYFTPRQVNEILWISVLGTFSLHGPMWRKILKALYGFLALPHTIYRLRSRSQKVDEMLKRFPQIPYLEAE